MGDKMTLNSIFPKGKSPLTALVVYTNGRWTFSPPEQYGATVRETPSEKYYKINIKFGLVRKGVTSPQPVRRGKPGEYVGRDINGAYSIFTEKQYEQAFPVKNLNPPYIPPSNKDLQDPNYLTNIVQEQEKQASNITHSSSYKVSSKKKMKAGSAQGLSKTGVKTGIYNK